MAYRLLSIAACAVVPALGAGKTAAKVFFVNPQCNNTVTGVFNKTKANYAMDKAWCEGHENQSWVEGSGYTGMSRFKSSTDGKSCWALEGEPRPPHYKLPMCKMYNENSCCAPIHDAETQWAYETLIDVADRCLQYVNEEHFALREFFCITCDPDQHKYMSMTDPDGGSASVFAGDYNRDNWGEIRICKHFAQRMWQSGSNDGKEYDMCGFSIFTDDNGVVPYGDVNPATGDDPILPSKYWTDNAKSEDGASRTVGGVFGVDRGLAYEAFMNTIKPGMLDNFQFRVVDSRENCFKGAGAAALLPQLLLAAFAACAALFVAQ